MGSGRLAVWRRRRDEAERMARTEAVVRRTEALFDALNATVKDLIVMLEDADRERHQHTA